MISTISCENIFVDFVHSDLFCWLYCVISAAQGPTGFSDGGVGRQPREPRTHNPPSAAGKVRAGRAPGRTKHRDGAPAEGVKEVVSQRPPKKCSPEGWGASSLVKTHPEFATHNRSVRGFPRNLGGLPRAVVSVAETNDEVVRDLEALLGCSEKRLDF